MNAQTPTVDRKSERILITREFDKLSSNPTSKEYRLLLQLQRNHPTFDIVIQKDKHRKSIQGKFTLEFMDKYIRSHDDANGSKMNQFLILCGKKEENGKLTKVSHFTLQKWFIDTFPEIKDRVEDAQSVTNEILRGAAENAEKHKAERDAKKGGRNDA